MAGDDILVFFRKLIIAHQAAQGVGLVVVSVSVQGGEGLVANFGHQGTVHQEVFLILHHTTVLTESLFYWLARMPTSLDPERVRRSGV